ncbi:hypothetical protein [Dactylosporangium sp. CS-033363]|uniref:hypothetical protein n=1 Tax=Dactylosporangium sp. CS-033363 TaxID=3239935 RepID=UPI003D8D1630
MTDTPTPAPRSRQARTALVLASVSLVLSLVACAVVAFADFDLLPVQSKPTEATAGQVEAVAHVTLPPGTVLLAAAYSNGLETRLSAKFRFPRTALDPFVAAAKFTAPVTPGLRAVTAAQNVGGGNLFDPDAAVSVSGIKEDQPTADGTYRSALFGLDAPDTVTVYLYASRG